jgi:hypothetical protein
MQRRELLKSLLASPLLALLPKRAEPESLPQPELLEWKQYSLGFRVSMPLVQDGVDVEGLIIREMAERIDGVRTRVLAPSQSHTPPAEPPASRKGRG